MNRKKLFSSFSNTAFVVLMTLSASSWAQAENYGMAALMLVFAFAGPVLLFDNNFPSAKRTIRKALKADETR